MWFPIRMFKRNGRLRSENDEDGYVNMKAIFAVMNTTWTVVKIRPENIQACTGFEPMTSAQVVFITTKIAFTFTSLSAVQIHDFHIFTVVYSSLHGFFRNQHNDQFPSWLDSSVGRALHRYCRGHGFKSRTGLNFFFRPYFHYAQEVFITAKIAFIFTSLSAIKIYYFHIFTVV